MFLALKLNLLIAQFLHLRMTCLHREPMRDAVDFFDDQLQFPASGSRSNQKRFSGAKFVQAQIPVPSLLDAHSKYRAAYLKIFAVLFSAHHQLAEQFHWKMSTICGSSRNRSAIPTDFFSSCRLSVFQTFSLLGPLVGSSPLFVC